MFAHEAGDLDRALGWLEALGDDEPFFAWVHLFDPHFPYIAPAGIYEQQGEIAKAIADRHEQQVR